MDETQIWEVAVQCSSTFLSSAVTRLKNKWANSSSATTFLLLLLFLILFILLLLILRSWVLKGR